MISDYLSLPTCKTPCKIIKHTSPIERRLKNNVILYHTIIHSLKARGKRALVDVSNCRKMTSFMP